ncbi:MAG: MG2 domain-containing protein, partial [Candidatus Cryptobacteroides sp.]
MNLRKLLTGCLMTAFVSVPLHSADNARTRVARLWDDYGKYESRDLPDKSAKTLLEIKEIAGKSGLSYDYFEASEKYVGVMSRKNWKLRRELTQQKNDEYRKLGDPVVLYAAGLAEDFPVFLEEWEKRLKNGRSSDFWKKRPVAFKGAAVASHIQNDYEYVLLSEIFRGPANPSLCKTYLDSCRNSYPVGALVEFASLDDRRDSLRDEHIVEAYRAYAERHGGKAVATMARIRECKLMFRIMNSGKTGEFVRENAIDGKAWRQEDYLSLRNRCEDLVREKNRFGGEEKMLLEDECGAEKLIETLDSKSIFAEIRGNEVKAGLRNLDEVRLSILAGSSEDAPEVFSCTLENRVRNYYVIDTLRTILPPLADGEYTAVFVSGKCRKKLSVKRNSLAVTLDRSAGGWLVYIAERMDGKPVREAEIEIRDVDDRLLLKKNLELDGPTLLDGEFAVALEGGPRKLVARSTSEVQGCSSTLYVNGYANPGTDPGKEWQAMLITDRGAYRPGGSVEFKSVIYKDFRNGRMSTAPEGVQVCAVLRDAEDRSVAKMQLQTNAFGSVAGSIPLPRDCRNGTWKIAVFIDGCTLNARWFTVDEFKLPDYGIDFIRDGVKYFPGDKIPVRGKVTSYAGNSLDELKLRYEISSHGAGTVTGVPLMDDDGNFCFYVESDPSGSGHYTIRLLLTDAAGQSIEKNVWLSVGKEFGLDCDLEGIADGEFCRDETGYAMLGRNAQAVLRDDGLVFKPLLTDIDGTSLKASVKWQLLGDGEVLYSGICGSGDRESLSLKGHPSGLYLLKLEKEYVYEDRDGRECRISRSHEVGLLKLSGDDGSLGCRLDNAFKVLEQDGSFGILFGSSTAPVWANVMLFDLDGRLLEKSCFHLDGTEGNNLKNLRWTFRREWTDRVMVKISYIRNGRCHSFSHQFTRNEDSFRLPLGISRFSDSLLPGTEYCLSFKSTADAEMAVAIFDRSTEDIAPNRWYGIMPSIRGIYIAETTSGGCDFYASDFHRGEAMPFMLASAKPEFTEDAAMAPITATMNGRRVGSKASATAGTEIRIRDSFRNTVLFEPFIRTAEDGTAQLRFTAPDRLSTYIVSVFAHDREFHNSVLRDEFTVSQPVSITVHEPSLLYSGDIWHFRPLLSNNTGQRISGTLEVCILDGESRTLTAISRPVELEANGSRTPDLEVRIPEAESLQSFADGRGRLKIKAVFSSKDASDGIAVRIPVIPCRQHSVETHSAVLLPGADREKLRAELQAEFVNFSGESATEKERKLSLMLEEVMEGKTGIKSGNILDLSEVFCVRTLTGNGDRTEVWDKILRCRCSDGGFGWFAGFQSSPVLTAVLLERLAGLRKAGYGEQQMEAIFPDAVKYIDSTFFVRSPDRFRNLSAGQYLRVRSFFPEIAVDAGLTKGNKDMAKKGKQYAGCRNGKSIPEGRILEKALRAGALVNILESHSQEFAKSLGLGRSKMERLASSDMESLKEYAVEHYGGGCYYPNAVMPFRLLMESEAYCHSVICDLMDGWNGYSGRKGKPD